MSYPQTPPQPSIPASELRPSRAWYWIAGVIAVIGVCVGGIVGALGFTSLARDMPMSMDTEFDAGNPATVELSTGKTWGIYVLEAQGRADVSADCTGNPANGGSIDLNRADFNMRFGSRDGAWRLLYDVEVSETGRYQIACQVTSGSKDTRFGISESINVGGTVGRFFGSLGALLGIPCLALTVAGIIALVAAVRRNSHKKRLQQERGGYPPGTGYQGPGGPPAAGYPPPGPPPPGSPPSGSLQYGPPPPGSQPHHTTPPPHTTQE
jgi:hypothetical protein